MFEYGVNVTNKFGSLTDDEVSDPEEMLRKAETAGKREKKTASQKKADKSAAAKRKKETAVAAAAAAAAAANVAAATLREAEAKRGAAVPQQQRRFIDPANKENRPDGERGRGRGRGRGAGGFVRGGRGGVGGFGGGGAGFGGPPPPPGDGTNRFPGQDQGMETFGDRFGEGRGRGGRGRGGRGGRSFRGRGGMNVSFQMEPSEQQQQDQPMDEMNMNNAPLVNGADNNTNNTEFVTGGGGGGGYRGGYRGGRGGGGGFRGGLDGERPAFRGGRGGRGRQFDRLSGSDKTGVKPNEKRDGYGKGNWGTDQDELTGETEQLNTAVQQDGDKSGDEAVVVAPREKTEEELRLEAEAEALAKQITLDEFKAQIAAKRSQPQFNIRKAGEGANDKQFGKLVPLPREEIIEEQHDEEIVVVVCLTYSFASGFPVYLYFSSGLGPSFGGSFVRFGPLFWRIICPGLPLAERPSDLISFFWRRIFRPVWPFFWRLICPAWSPFLAAHLSGFVPFLVGHLSGPAPVLAAHLFGLPPGEWPCSSSTVLMSE